MPLTPEQIKMYRQQYGLEGPAEEETVETTETIEDPEARIARLEAEAEEIALQGASPVGEEEEFSFEETIPEKKGFGQGVKEAFNSRVNKAADAQIKAKEGKQKGVSAAIQTLGQGAGFVGDIGFEALKAVTPDKIERKVGNAFGKIAATEPVQKVVGKVNEFAERNPEAAANIGAFGNIASLVPVGKSAQLLGKGAKNTVKKGLGTATGFAAKQTAKKQAKNFDTVVDMVKENVPKSSRPDSDFVKGVKNQGLSRKGLFKADELLPSEKDIARARAVQDVIDPKKPLDENQFRVAREIGDHSNTKLEPFLKENPAPYHWIELKDYLDNKGSRKMFKGAKDTTDIYDAVMDDVLEIAAKHEPNTYGLWKARTEIDNLIEKRRRAFGKDPARLTGIDQAAMDGRNAINDFIEDSLKFKDMTLANQVDEYMDVLAQRGIKLDSPELVKEELRKHFGLEVLPENELNAMIFRNHMKRLKYLYEAEENLAVKQAKLSGIDKVGQWMKRNPKTTKAAKLIGGAGAAGVGLKIID